jgi:hypothetical protein
VTREIEGKGPPTWLRVLTVAGVAFDAVFVYMFLQVDDLAVRIGGVTFGSVLAAGQLIVWFAFRRYKG